MGGEGSLNAYILILYKNDVYGKSHNHNTKFYLPQSNGLRHVPLNDAIVPGGQLAGDGEIAAVLWELEGPSGPAGTRTVGFKFSGTTGFKISNSGECLRCSS